MTTEKAAVPRTITVTGTASGLVQEITVGGHRLIGDEPVADGGTDIGPSPYDLLLAATHAGKDRGAVVALRTRLYADLIATLDEGALP